MANTAGYMAFANEALGTPMKGEAIKETPRTALARSMKYLHEAVGASRRVREELCGSWPEDDGASQKLPYGGFFGEVESAASDIERMACEIHNHINAIQSRM